MTEPIRFDLIEIAKILQQRRRYILVVTLAAALCGTLFYLISKKKFVAKSEFLVVNPLYSDRNNLFRTDQALFLNYFGNEDDIDKVLAIAKSGFAEDRIIHNTHLAQAYKTDTTSKEDYIKLYRRFEKSYDPKRTEHQSMEVYFTDTDPNVAAAVTNEAVRVIGNMYSEYFNTLRDHARQSLKMKVQQLDSVIASMTDSLAGMRDRYGIYEIISPNRKNMMGNGAMHGGGTGYGRAIEELQNLESIKDKMVEDRANNISLMNEFSTGTKEGELPLIQVITNATPPDDPKGLGLVLTVVVCALVGAFFSALWLLLSAYFRGLTLVQR